MDVGSDHLSSRRYPWDQLCRSIQKLWPIPVCSVTSTSNGTSLLSVMCFISLIGMHHCRRNKALISELSAPPPGSKDLYFPTQYSQSFLTQCMACLWKQHKSYWRNPSYTATRIFFTTVIALIFGTIFLNLGKKMWVPLLTAPIETWMTWFCCHTVTKKLNCSVILPFSGTRQDLFNSLGSMYAAVLFIGIQNGQTVQPIVDVERTVFYREKAAGMYSALPYAFAQVTGCNWRFK